MGNCFGKTNSDSARFQGEGRTLAATSAPANEQPRPTPALQPGSAGRTVGGAYAPAEGDARSAAARAAEERAAKAQATAQKGKLSQQLAQQKQQTQTEILKSQAEEQRRHREIDEGNAHLAHR